MKGEAPLPCIRVWYSYPDLKSRIPIFKRLLAVFGCVSGLVLLAALVIWVIPYYRSVRELKDAISRYQKAGLPVRKDEVFNSNAPDHVSPILEELWKIRHDPKVFELLKRGEPYSDEVKYSARMFTRIYFAGSDSLSWKEPWDCPKEKLVYVQRFCADHRTQHALSLLREAARYDYRNGTHDSVFHGVWLPNGQDTGREYLPYLLIDQNRIAGEDPSKSHDIFQTLMLKFKIENLLIQGYTFTHYEERVNQCVEAFKEWMHFDRIYGTPADLIDELSHCMNPQKEEEIWLKCHDNERISGMGYTQKYCNIFSEMDIYSRSSPTWKSWITVKMPFLLRKPFRQIAGSQDYSFFLRRVLATRGVTARHLQAAEEIDEMFHMRNEHGGVLFMPPYYELYIKSYHELMMWHEILMTGLAVNSFADAHGYLPESLDDLVPAYLPTVPQDRFPIEAPQKLAYQVDGEVFDLRSSAKDIFFRGRRTR